MLTMSTEDPQLPSNTEQLDNNNDKLPSNNDLLPSNEEEISSDNDHSNNGFSKLERSETVIHRENDNNITKNNTIPDEIVLDNCTDEPQDENKQYEEEENKKNEDGGDSQEISNEVGAEENKSEEDETDNDDEDDDEEPDDESEQENSFASNCKENKQRESEEIVTSESVVHSEKETSNRTEEKDLMEEECCVNKFENITTNENEENNHMTNQNTEDNIAAKKDEDITSKEELSINDKDDDELKDEKENITESAQDSVSDSKQEQKTKFEKNLKEKVNKEVIKNPLRPKIRGCDVNKADKHKITPLHQVFIKLDESLISDENDIEIIELLLELGADVNAKTSQGHAPLHYAVGFNRSVSILQALVKGGAELDITDDKGCTPLYYAIAPLTGSNSSDFEYRNDEIAKYLIQKGARIDVLGQSGRRTCTALQVAVYCRRLEIVKTMLKNLNYECNFDIGLPWLHTIVNWNNFSLQTENKLHGFNALFLAVNNKDIAMVTELVQAGALVNALNHDKMSPMHFITKENPGIINSEQIENEKDLLTIANYLIEHGADLNLIDGRTNNGRTALQYAIINGHTEIAKLIIEKGQNVDLNLKENENNMSAIFFALSNNKQILYQLINHPDVDLTLQDNQEKTILHYAVQKEPDVARTLAKTCRKLINMADKQGKTALHYMALDNEQMVEMLIQRGADVNVEDGRGKTPLHYALFGGNKTIVKYLLRHGGKTPCVTPQSSLCMDE